jgi:hypothetical protein
MDRGGQSLRHQLERRQLLLRRHSRAPFCGTVYKLAKNGKRTILYKFTSGSDGPRSLRPCHGQGATSWRSPRRRRPQLPPCRRAWLRGRFKLDPAGKETVLDRFKGGADGAVPSAGLGLVGEFGNASNPGFKENFGCGTVFQVKKTCKFTFLDRFGTMARKGGPKRSTGSRPCG